MAEKKLLNFEDFKLAGESEHAYDILHPEGSTFQVAKKGLNEDLLGRIASMPSVAPPPTPATPGPVAPDPVAAAATPNPVFESVMNAEIEKYRPKIYDPVTGQTHLGEPHPNVLQGIKDRVTNDYANYQKAIADPLHTSPMALENLKAQFRAPALKGTLADATGGALPPGDHSAGPLQAGQMVPEGDLGISATAGKAQAAPGAVPNPDAAQNSAFALQRQGILGAAKAQQDAATAQADAYKAQEERLKAAADDYKANRERLDGENAKLYQDVLDDKIEPGRFMANLSTGNKILAGISLVLGGAGGGLNGSGRNTAMEVLQKTIDQDIEAQKANLGKKQSLLTQNLQKTRDLQEAEAMTRSQIMAMTSAQVERAKASASGPLAKAQADQLLGVLKVEQSKANEAAAQRAAIRKLGQGNLEGINPEELRATGNPQLTDAADRMIRLPSGKQRLANRKEDVKDLTDKIATVQPIYDGLTRLSKYGPADMLDPKKREQVDFIRQALAVSLKKNTELNRMFASAGKEGDGFNLMDLIENPKEFRNIFGESGKVELLRNYVEDTLNAELNAKLSGGYQKYTPPSVKGYVANQQKEKN